MSSDEAVFNIVGLMKRLERDIAALYSLVADSVHDEVISSIMRKIGIESATHNYILTLVEVLMKECPPRRTMDLETLTSIQGNIEESLTHVREIMDFVHAKRKIGEDVTTVIVEKLNELEGFENDAVKIYSFLLRSYLPITSTKANTKRRTISKLIIKLLRGISDDEREHQELLTLVNELLRKEKG